MRTRLIPTAGVAVMLLLACGGGGSSPPLDLAAVARMTEAAGTARVELSATVAMPEQPEITVAGTGVVDLAADRLHLRLRLPAPLGGGSLEALADPDRVLLRSDALDAAGRWVRIPHGRDAALGGLGGLGGGGADPVGLLRDLGAARPTDLGADDVGGVPARRHHLRLPAGGEVTIWVDRRGRLRRYQHRRSEGAGTLTVDLRLHHLGAPVDIPSVEAGSVLESTDLAARQQVGSSPSGETG